MRGLSSVLYKVLTSPWTLIVLSVGMIATAVLMFIVPSLPNTCLPAVTLAVGGFFFGSYALAFLLGHRLRSFAVQLLLEQRRLAELAGEHGIAVAAILHLDLRGWLPNIFPLDPEYTVIATLKRPEDWAFLLGLLGEVTRADVRNSPFHGTPRVRLYTALQAGCIADADIPDEVFQQLMEVTRGEWYYLGDHLLPWESVIHTSRGTLVSLQLGERWHDVSSLAGVLGIDRTIQELRRRNEPRICARTQAVQLARLAGKIHTFHLTDFAQRGFAFGGHTDLLTGSAPDMLAETNVDRLQSLEDEAFRNLTKELLQGACRITSVWPLSGDSLRYVTSDRIKEWQDNVTRHLLDHRGAKADRYLMIPAGGPEGSPPDWTLPEPAEVPLTDGTMLELPPLAVLEAVVGKYLWDALGTRRLRLFAVPLQQSADNRAITFQRYARALGIEQADMRGEYEALSSRFLLDWVVIERPLEGRSVVVLQYDDPLFMAGCGGSRLLVHRYFIRAGDPFERSGCNRRTCEMRGVPVVRDFCCLAKVLKYDTERLYPLAPRRIAGRRSAFREMWAKIRSRAADDFYGQEWDPLLRALRDEEAPQWAVRDV